MSTGEYDGMICAVTTMQAVATITAAARFTYDTRCYVNEPTTKKWRTENQTKLKRRISNIIYGWLGSRVVSVLDSGAEEPWFKSQPRRCRVTVLSKLFTPIVLLFTKQQNW